MTTETQIKILTRPTVSGYQNAEYFPLFGSGDHRSANALVKQGFGRIVSGFRLHHATEYFFKFDEGFRFNWVTRDIEAIK